MRLNLRWRGWDVIDVELHAWRRRPDDQPADSDAPSLHASGGGQAERADTYGDPATIASFGFQAARTQPAPDAWDGADYRDGRKSLRGQS